MKPNLITIQTGIDWLGPIKLPAYFTMVSIGFLLAVWLAKRWAKQIGIDHKKIVDLGIFMIIFGILGARLLHVIADGQFWNYVYWCIEPQKVEWHVTEVECKNHDGIWDSVKRVCKPSQPHIDCLLWLKFWHGGLAFYGGFILATIFGLWYIKREKLPLGKVTDMASWTIPLGLTWGRIGCFLNGCCFGKPTTLPWAVQFPKWSIAFYTHLERDWVTLSDNTSLPVHPTQLYESLASLFIFGFIYFYLSQRKRFDGELFLVSTVLYATFRFIIEFVRDDERGGIGFLSTSQIIGVIAIITSIIVWLKITKKPQEE